MKSYVQGLITGAVLVFVFMVLMGASDNDDEVGRYQISSVTLDHYAETVFESIIDTKTGKVVKRNKVGTNNF
tara:strand:- start:518 stop:733 length:216 start_codon:yes stop_codon:yes gene_type:complete